MHQQKLSTSAAAEEKFERSCTHACMEGEKKNAHGNGDHTRRSHGWVTDRRSTVHWLKPHVMKKRDHNNVSLRPPGSRAKVGHGLHAAGGLRDRLCNQEVPFLLATLLSVRQSWVAEEGQFFFWHWQTDFFLNEPQNRVFDFLTKIF